MKKFLGVTALGVSLTLIGATASWAQATGGSGGAGGPANGTSSGTMSQPEAGSSMSQPNSTDAKKMQVQKDKSPASTGSGASQEK
jgi:hypothetical protein